MQLTRFLAILFLLIINNGISHAQYYLNLGFEAVREGIPYSWAINNMDGIISADSIENTSGKYSLKIIKNGKIPGSRSSFFAALDLDTAIMGDVRLKGKLKTLASDTGQASFLLMAVHQRKILVEKEESNGENIGVSGWREVDITIPSGAALSRIVLGGFCKGQVTAWFDDLELFINGRKHEVPCLSIKNPIYSSQFTLSGNILWYLNSSKLS